MLAVPGDHVAGRPVEGAKARVQLTRATSSDTCAAASATGAGIVKAGLGTPPAAARLRSRATREAAVQMVLAFVEGGHA